jgi:hypothetical protein
MTDIAKKIWRILIDQNDEPIIDGEKTIKKNESEILIEVEQMSEKKTKKDFINALDIILDYGMSLYDQNKVFCLNFDVKKEILMGEDMMNECSCLFCFLLLVQIILVYFLKEKEFLMFCLGCFLRKVKYKKLKGRIIWK